MAHFYGSMKGKAGEATRIGSKDSGLSAHIRGWNVGAMVFVSHEDGCDVVRVLKTSGSNGHDRWEIIAEFTEEG